jgi:heat shock protein HtpX
MLDRTEGVHVGRRYLNGVKTAGLFGLLWVVVLALGWFIGDGQYIWLFAGLGVLGTAYGYWNSDKIAIRAMRAQPVTEAQQPAMYRIVRELSAAAGQPMPRLYVSPTGAPNAFATGRNPKNAAVCCTEGILALLDERELRGVLGHELMHVYNRDILIGTVAATIATAVMFLSRFALFFGGGRDRNANPAAQILLVILGPIAAMIIQFAVTRSRETAADAAGAELCGKPLALASALQKLESGGKALAQRGVGGTPAETSSAFSSLYIAAPFGGAMKMSGLFRSHPKTEVRVANLEQIARRMGQIG